MKLFISNIGSKNFFTEVTPHTIISGFDIRDTINMLEDEITYYVSVTELTNAFYEVIV